MPGTGGDADAHYLIHKGNWVYDEAIECWAPQGVADAIANEAPDAPRVLAALRESLGLSITDLARVFDVSRPTIYAWMKGETEPRAELWPRLREMEQLASLAQQYSLSRPARLVRRPALDGTSLLERLQAGQEIGEEHLQALADLSRYEETQRAKPRGGAARPAEDVAAEYARPTG
ncbi:helix-turn-helix transcriptional regulator [Thioalkalivibrio sp. ALJT]|uniref:helix-turn-helix domain-containing protein n=1 Tax=Thioalkalivibrio sp. ALJT TaxID=1158146 RepID=UPI0003771A75|nr:helix-turn-helix transcriptional regulator [Thioalkalivibrio sp. ALJT]